MVLQGTATSRLNEAKYKVLHLDCGNPHYQYKLRDERLESWKKKKKKKTDRPGGTVGWEARQEPALYPCSPESQLHPGLHQKTHGQQVKGDPVPLLYAGGPSPVYNRLTAL